MRIWKFIKGEWNPTNTDKNNNSEQENTEELSSEEITDESTDAIESEEQTSEQNSSSEPSSESSSKETVSEEMNNESTGTSESEEQTSEQNSNSEPAESSMEESSSEEMNSNSIDGSESEEQTSEQNSSSEPSSELNSKETGSEEITNESSGTSESEEQFSEQNSSSEPSSESSSKETDSEEITNESSATSKSEEQTSEQNSCSELSSESSGEETVSEEMNSESTDASELEEQDSTLESNNDEDVSEGNEEKSESEESTVDDSKDQVDNYNKLTDEQKQALIEKIKKNIEEINKRRALKEQRKRLNSEKKAFEEHEEEQYELSEETNNFLKDLGELPSFENRERGAGYSIDTTSNSEVPESVIRTLITRFLNQRFCNNNTDLNIRSNSLEKSKGFYKWEVKDVIVHLKTHQVTKVLTDKYGYEYAQGSNENVPLSFYFDYSGSMSEYSNMLAVIAIELLKKDVKVLVGFNERINTQIDSINKNIDVATFADILESAGGDEEIEDSRVKAKWVRRDIDNYLKEKKAEKVVVFSDFDPIHEVINLSNSAEVYWFCFESSLSYSDIDCNLKDFKGFIYKVQSIKDLEKGLALVSKKRFETLCYADNPKSLQKKVGNNYDRY